MCWACVLINFFQYHFYFYKVVELTYPEVPPEEAPVCKPQKDIEMAPTRGMLG